MNVAVTPAYVAVPATEIPLASFSVNVAVVSVVGFKVSLKVTVTVVRINTPVASFAGLVKLTVGGVVSGPDEGGGVPLPPPLLQAVSARAQRSAPERTKVLQSLVMQITMPDSSPYVQPPRSGVS